VSHLSTRRAGCSQGVCEGDSHQGGASQALAEARTAPPGGLRAYVALRRFAPRRVRLRQEGCGLPIGMSGGSQPRPERGASHRLHRIRPSSWAMQAADSHRDSPIADPYRMYTSMSTSLRGCGVTEAFTYGSSCSGRRGSSLAPNHPLTLAARVKR